MPMQKTPTLVIKAAIKTYFKNLRIESMEKHTYSIIG